MRFGRGLFLAVITIFLSFEARASEYEVRAMLTPISRTIFSAQIAGRIVKLPFNEGDSFSKGSTIFALDCEIPRAQLSKAQTEVSAAREMLAAQEKLSSYQAGNLIDLSRAKHQLRLAEAEVSISSVTIRACSFVAPFDGAIVSRKAQLYQSVNSGSEIVEVIEAGTPKIQLLVPSSWLSWIKSGLEFSVIVDETGKNYPAIVEKTDKIIDPASQTVKVFAKFKGGFPDLLSGMSGTALFNPPSADK